MPYNSFCLGKTFSSCAISCRSSSKFISELVIINNPSAFQFSLKNSVRLSNSHKLLYPFFRSCYQSAITQKTTTKTIYRIRAPFTGFTKKYSALYPKIFSYSLSFWIYLSISLFLKYLYTVKLFLYILYNKKKYNATIFYGLHETLIIFYQFAIIFANKKSLSFFTKAHNFVYFFLWKSS